MEHRIRFSRTDNLSTLTGDDLTLPLKEGQPFYDKADNKLYIGQDESSTIGRCKNGTIKPINANHADTATNSENANHADTATNSENAENADKINNVNIYKSTSYTNQLYFAKDESNANIIPTSSLCLFESICPNLENIGYDSIEDINIPLDSLKVGDMLYFGFDTDDGSLVYFPSGQTQNRVVVHTNMTSQFTHIRPLVEDLLDSGISINNREIHAENYLGECVLSDSPIFFSKNDSFSGAHYMACSKRAIVIRFVYLNSQGQQTTLSSADHLGIRINKEYSFSLNLQNDNVHYSYIPTENFLGSSSGLKVINKVRGIVGNL